MSYVKRQHGRLDRHVPAPERGTTPRRRKETFVIGKALALALLLLALPLPAEEPPAPAAPAAPAGVPLSLVDATARALANNNDIAIERESFRIVDASLLRADAPYDPTFRLDARYRNSTDPANRSEERRVGTACSARW